VTSIEGDVTYPQKEDSQYCRNYS